MMVNQEKQEVTFTKNELQALLTKVAKEAIEIRIKELGLEKLIKNKK